jgi:hypothetical protein
MGDDAMPPPNISHSSSSPLGHQEMPLLQLIPPRQSRHHPYSQLPSSSTAFASPDPSHYTGLTKQQQKALKAETKKIEDQIDLWSAVFAHLYGETPDHDALVNSLARVCDSIPQIRTFSGLTTKDYRLLNPGERGLIFCSDSLLASSVPTNFIPTSFWPGLQTLRRTCSRTMGTGVRQIIGYFLAHAVDIARGLFDKMARLVVHTEVEIPVVDIPEIGKVHGPMEFLISPAAGTAPIGYPYNG